MKAEPKNLKDLPKDIINKIAIDNFDSALDLEAWAQTNLKNRRAVDIDKIFRRWEQDRMPNNRWRILSQELSQQQVKLIFIKEEDNIEIYYSYIDKKHFIYFENKKSAIKQKLYDLKLLINDSEPKSNHLDYLIYKLFEKGYSLYVKRGSLQFFIPRDFQFFGRLETLRIIRLGPAQDLEQWAQCNVEDPSQIDNVFRQFEQKRMPNDRFRILTHEICKDIVNKGEDVLFRKKNPENDVFITNFGRKLMFYPTTNTNLEQKLLNLNLIQQIRVDHYNIIGEEFIDIIYNILENGYYFQIKKNFVISCNICSLPAFGKCCQLGAYCGKYCQSQDIQHVCK